MNLGKVSNTTTSAPAMTLSSQGLAVCVSRFLELRLCCSLLIYAACFTSSSQPTMAECKHPEAYFTVCFTGVLSRPTAEPWIISSPLTVTHVDISEAAFASSPSEEVAICFNTQLRWTFVQYRRLITICRCSSPLQPVLTGSRRTRRSLLVVRAQARRKALYFTHNFLSDLCHTHSFRTGFVIDRIMHLLQ